MRKLIFFCLFVLYGCASSTQAHLDTIQNNFAHGDFKSATQNLSSNTEPEKQNNLELLINGVTLFHENEFKESDSVFEEFNKRNLSETDSSIVRETTGLLFGQGINSYKPYMMDSLFVSYYQLWDLLAMHDFKNARVVINQSYIRQQKMSTEYKKLISDRKQDITPELQEIIGKNTSDWVMFNDIMNPALMYLSGIYFLTNGDFENAITYLKRASGMVPDNTFIKQDLQLAQQYKKPTNITWQFAETGFAPRLHEQHAGLYLFNIGMIYFAFSEPYFSSGSIHPQNSQMLANVDAMFLTEYNEYRTNEILRSYASAVSKATLQATMYNSHSSSAPLLGILSSIYTVSSSNTDVRTWATLPQYIYVTRIENTKSNLNDLIVNDNIKSEIKPNTNNLVYVRMTPDIVDAKIINLK